MGHVFAHKAKQAPAAGGGIHRAPVRSPQLHRILQRKCACGGETGSSGQCAECSKQKGKLQRQSAGRSEPDTVPPIVHNVLRSPGQPLDRATRAYMEPRFGHDFSRVRVHADARAAESARAVNASAYTAGSNIVFGAAMYQPQTSSGNQLLAHELAHSIQQGNAESAAHTVLEVGKPEGATEHEAEVAAGLVARGRAVSVTTVQGLQVARQSSDTELPETGATTTTTAVVTASPEAEEADTIASCALTTYTGSNLVGDTVVADVEFTDSLDAINKHAADNKVNLHVTSSFRTSTDVPGAVVTPATMSNHMAGHAIDMNVKYGENKDKWCNSSCLGGVLPAEVSGVIKAIQDDAGLRWGGDFNTKDPVHIDDNLNADVEAWKKRKEATQAARVSGCG